MILAYTRTLQCVAGFFASGVLPVCSGCPVQDRQELTGKVLDVVAFAVRPLYRLDNPTTLLAYCVRCGKREKYHPLNW